MGSPRLLVLVTYSHLVGVFHLPELDTYLPDPQGPKESAPHGYVQCAALVGK